MCALTANRDTREVVGALVSLTVKADTTIYAGALVAVDATGYALPAANTAGLKVVGRAEHGATGGLPLLVKRGVFLFENKAGDLVVAADIGSYCYVGDDETVQHTANSNAIVAGLVRGVTADGVYVDTTPNPDGAAAGAAAGATAGAAAIAADLADGSSTIKAAAAALIAAAGNARLVTAPVAANSAGVKGDIAIDEASIYLCTATNTWVKAALVFAAWSE